ncbi:MAG: hypothetical protein AVDCRST_MAG18-3853 [uncultured Thermomicrobiales bacterium]|uniref:Putative zinc-finger domain-containing protein n=1 Tax=uncultured Thermomicrobiales bacterium TaxID=1645740 RepID=A0A6J4VQW5_9BACT|nr:MAG: hypothetical protein AVDCRST_MAG18-3853 [uncultured Thermomicrobiales bacterium]
MTTAECARIEELISARQDRAASPDERAQVERHIAGCDRCRATAAAFGRVDHEVRRYIGATPVPEIAAPWRSEPFARPVHRGEGLGHWRATTVGLAAIFALLFTASLLAFRPFATERPQSASFANPTVVAATDNSAPEAGQVAVAVPTAAIAAAPVQPAPTQGAAARSANSAAPAAAPAAGAAAPAAPAATSTRMAAPMGGATMQLNPAQLFQLASTDTLLLCQPDCNGAPQPETLRAAVVAAINRPLAPIPPATAPGPPEPSVTLRFTSASGRSIDVGYYPQSQRLQLPNGRGQVTAPPELVSALDGVIAPR